MANISNFVSSQNADRAGLPSSVNLTYANDSGIGYGQSGAVTSATNIAIGWQAGATTLPTTESGSSRALYNALVLDGTHASTGYQFNVDSTGALTITNEANSTTMTATGLSYVLFNDGATNTAGYSSSDMFIIASGNNAEIARFYQTTFNRIPDLPGYEAWTQALANGTVTVTQAAQDFIQSGEFTSTYGAVDTLSDTQFVTDLYTNMLGRTPDASGLAAWVSYLGTVEATNGSTAAGNIAARGLILQDFAVSSEEISHSSSWLIDTSHGGYADPSTGVSPQTAVNQAASTGVINGATMAPTTTSVYSPDYGVSPTTGVVTGTAVAVEGPTVTIITGIANAKVIIGANGGYANGYANGATICGDNSSVELNAIGQGVTISSNNDTVNINVKASNASSTHVSQINGDGISMGGGGVTGTSPAEYYSPTNLVISGFVPGVDFLKGPLSTIDHQMSPGYTVAVTLLDGTASHIAGSTLNFAKNIYVVYLGNVGDGSAASVAAVAASEYTPAGQAGSVPQGLSWNGGSSVTPGENITFIGQTSSGNTVVYDYANWQSTTVNAQSVHAGQTFSNTYHVFAPTGNPDLHGTHVITADELTLNATLVGVTTAHLTAADFL